MKVVLFAALVAAASATTTIQVHQNLGCYGDHPSPRVFDGKHYLHHTNTIEQCFDYCRTDPAGYQYFGVENGQDCWCGTASIDYKKYGARPNCGTPCPGNPSEKCGGYWAVDVYEINKITYEGCWKDTSVRIFHHPVLSQDNTLQGCYDQCTAIPHQAYFGVENGQDCWCGTANMNYKKFGEASCNKPCTGDHTEICGDYYAMGVYSLAAPDQTQPIYRLYSHAKTDHAYTPTVSVAQTLVAEGYQVESAAAFETYTEPSGNLKTLYQLKNSMGCQGHCPDHLYTTNEGERSHLLVAGWEDKGDIGYCAPTQVAGTVPLYRFFRGTNGGDHLYTTSETEKSSLLGFGVYQFQGVACYVPGAAQAGMVAMAAMVANEAWRVANESPWLSAAAASAAVVLLVAWARRRRQREYKTIGGETTGDAVPLLAGPV